MYIIFLAINLASDCQGRVDRIQYGISRPSRNVTGWAP